jgi:hypothetical protein
MHYARAGGRRRYKTPHLHVPPICLYLLCSALLAHQRFWTLRSIQRRGSGSTDRRWARAGPVRACVHQVQVGRCEHESAHATQGRRTAENRQAGRRVEQNPTPGPHRPSNGNAGDVFEPCVLTVIGWAPTIAHLLACYARSSTAHVVGRLHGGTVPWICMYVRVRWAFQKQREMVRAVPNPSRETRPRLPCLASATRLLRKLHCAARRGAHAVQRGILHVGELLGPASHAG